MNDQEQANYELVCEIITANTDYNFKEEINKFLKTIDTNKHFHSISIAKTLATHSSSIAAIMYWKKKPIRSRKPTNTSPIIS